jgi:Flp pilus assembly protein TadB
MTTAEQFASIVAPDVPIAGVPWPRYKLIALLVGLVVAVVVGLLTMSAAPSVLAGAAAGTLAWLVLGFLGRARR